MDALTASAIRKADRVAFALLMTVGLVIGGVGASILYVAVQTSADDASWTSGPTMMLPRAYPEVATLANGDILAIGGLSLSGPTATTEVFDVGAGVWKAGPSMAVKRVGHTATLLKDGTVLVLGGETGTGTTDRVELVDVAKGMCYMLPDMTFARSGHASVRLDDGRVLVTGGTDWIHGAWSQAEIFDPVARTWAPAGNMNSARVGLTMQLLGNGEAIAIGGDYSGTSEIFDPVTGEWTDTASMSSKRIHAASVVTESGHVMVAGGTDSSGAKASAEMYDPDTGVWYSAGTMLSPRAHFTLSLLQDGRVLAAGSYTEDGGTTSSAELFCQCTMAWASTTPMIKPRGAHGAAGLPDGDLLMIGGRSGDSITPSTEVYTPPSSGPEPPPPPPPPPYCQPKDILPFVLDVAHQMPGYSFHGLVAKVLVAQVYYENGLIEDCLYILDAFYNEVRAFLNNEHVDYDGIASLYAAYASVVQCLGGTPLPELP